MEVLCQVAVASGGQEAAESSQETAAAERPLAVPSASAVDPELAVVGLVLGPAEIDRLPGAAVVLLPVLGLSTRYFLLNAQADISAQF